MSEKVSLEFVAGVGHSGSTVLGMLLGAREDRFFLSEWKRLTWLDDKTCYCGKTPDQCEYWGDVNPVDWRDLLRRAKEVKGEEVDTLVDSSKDLYSLRLREEHPSLDVSVVHLVRSPWKNMRKYGFIHLFMWAWTHTLVPLFCWWFGLDHRTVYYEEIVGAKGSDVERQSRQERYHFYTGNGTVRHNYEGVQNK